MVDGTNWNGGQIEITRSRVDGWDVHHRTEEGGHYSVDWQKNKTNALRVGKVIAEQRGALLLVQA